MAFDKVEIASKLLKIHNLSGVRAVAPGSQVADQDRETAWQLAAETGVDPADAMAFEKAGWTFVRPSLAGETEGNYDLVIDVDGHLKVVGHALTVKFDPALSRGVAESILNQYGLSISRQLGFSPNLFVVIGAQDDIMSKARLLNQQSSIIYAEPMLIEPIGGR